MGRTKPSQSSEAADHPIAWFSALLRGVDQADPALVETAQLRLEQLGYRVVPMRRPAPAMPPHEVARPGDGA